MKTKSSPLARAALFFATLVAACPSFAGPVVKIDTVRVADAGNPNDPSTGYGGVSYEFSIGKYEISLAQYTAFLNAVATSTSAPSHIQALYNASMESDSNIAGIRRTTVNGAYAYEVIGTGSRPVTYVSWFDAARFCNWMHNGGIFGSSTETGAYTLNGATSGIITKNAEANWWIPSESEWYKAAYYKGGSNGGYWSYPTKSDTMPDNNVGSLANQANIYDGLFAVNQLNSETGNLLTEPGLFTGSPSPYKTFDQAGNVWEWTDGAPTTYQRISRGGSWRLAANLSASSSRDTVTPATDDRTLGFRIACNPMMRIWLTIEAVPDFSGVPFRPVSIAPSDVDENGRVFFDIQQEKMKFFRTKIELLPQ